MKRRLFSLFLALTLVVGMLPAPAFAQETESTQATQAPTEAPTPTEAPRAEPTQAPTEAPTEAPAAEPTQPVTEAQPTEPPVPAFTEPARDEAVAAVQAMIDALPDVEHMSESYRDALEAAYSAFDALSETQQAQITGVEKLEALFGWVNSQVSTLAAEETISGVETWNNRTFATPVKLTGDTTLTLVGDNKIECDAPLDLNNCKLTVKGTGSLTVIGNGRSDTWMCNGAIFDSTYNGYNKGGTLTLAGGTVKASGGEYNAISVRSVELRGGKLEANGGSNAGIVCSYLYTHSGSLYATGSDCGIEMRTRYASNPGNLTILASDEKDASKADMDVGDIGDINGNAKKKTYYIGEVSGPMLSVKAQKGYLYEGTADQTATFSYSAKNLDGCMFGVEWTGAHPGLTAEFSLSVDQTIIVTTEDTVKKGTYELKLIARDAENVNTLATKTFTVTVLGAPITVTAQPQDASVSCKRGDLDAWQGDKKIQVTAKLVAGLTGDIAYQWKLEDGTELDNCTGYELFLQDLFVGGKLPQVAGKPWLSSAKVYCTLTYGSHSVNTNAVTLTVNTCVHENAKPDGNCRQCGEPCSSEPLLVREDGAYYAVDTSGIGDAEVGGGILTSGGTFYLTKDVLSRDMNAGNYTAGSENVILDLQGHTLKNLKMGNFPYGTFTLKNGTLGVIDTVAGGKLILENIHYKDTLISAQFDLTVQGENTRFELPVVFHGTTHLRGGHFEQGLDVTCVDRALDLLDAGFAFRNDQGIVDASNPENLRGKTIQVVAHACNYVNGKCECGRSCDHPGMDSTTGKCTVCGLSLATASVAANGTTTYFANFSVALEAAKSASGSTLTLFQDVALTGENNLYIDSGTFTIDWNGHTLSGSPGVDLLAISQSADVTLTDSSDNNAGGVCNTGYGAAVRIAVESRGSVNIQGGTYSPQVMRSERCYGSVSISGGVFKNPQDASRNYALYDESGRSLSGMLVDGTAFAYEADGSELLNAYAVSQSDSFRTVYAVAHTHESFENGVCSCGYKCPHEHWTDGVCELCGYECPHEEWKDGKCTVCGYPCPHEDVTENGGVYTCDNCGLTMTVMVETADGNVSYTTDLAAALNNAENGTTVKLLGDVSLENSAYIKDGKEVTLNLNGHNITRAGWKIIQVQGNTDDGTKAKLVITGSGEIRFNVKAIDGGQLDMSDWTGTVTCVDLENACDLVGPIGNGHLGELNISNWRSDNKGTILLQGGTIGKLWLNSFESFQMTLGSLLKSGCAAKSGSEYLPYDHAIQNGGSVNDLTIVPCPHTGLDSSGRCTYCNTTGFVATVTKDGVTTGYTDFQSALGEICDGKRGTLKLLTDVNGQYVYRISGTLDLNGKNLAGKLVCAQGSNLQIVNSGSDMSGMEKLEVWNGAKVTIADTAGSILFDMVTVESGSVADLLPEGGVYFRTDMRTWISAAEAATKQTLGSVVVREAPVKSVTLTPNKTTVTYGESQTVTLTASATLSEGETASYAWAEVKSDGTVQTFTEEVETSFTLPAGVNAGEHTYRFSVTVGDYTLSKDIQITVTKAPGKLENKDYPTEFTYGQTVPTPTAENFTSNHPDGTFSYYWLTGDGSIGLETGANPTRAGTYMLCATWTGGTNYTTASLSLAVTIQKAPQTANIAVVNETISGKGDGGVKLLPSAEGYEMRKKGEATFEPIEASQGQTFMTLTPGVTYEIRLAETKNYLPSDYQEVTVQPGRKLEVTLPSPQTGYTLTASKTQLGWHEDVELSFQLDSVGAYKAADFGIWAEAGSEKTKLTLGNDGAVKLTAPEKDITITVTGVKTDDVAPKVYIQGRRRTDGFDHVKWEGFQANPADDYVNGDFVISATDRVSGMASLWYCLSQTPLTLAEMDTASWKQEGKVSITEDGEYYLYAKALDKANNAGYACTGKLVKESNPPTFSGVKDGETYYVSQQMEIHDDGMPDWYMAKGSIGVVPNGGNENPIKLRLPNNGSSYTFTVGDRCGNEATITVHMKPLTDLTQPLYSILEGSIQKTDRATLDDVEATLKGLDVTYATEGEKEEINRALARIAELRQVLDQVAAVEAQIDALPNSVEPYQQTVEDTQIKPARDAYNSLTDHQKTLVDSTKLDKLVRLEAQLDAWTITEGDGQTWYKGSGKSLSFTVNGQRRKFEGIRQGNTYIGSGVSSLLTASGEVDEPFTLTLKPEFLQCQTPGEHSFTVLYSGLYSGYLSISVTYTVETPANYLDVTNKPEFDGKTTVTIDGKEYPIEEMAGYLQRIPTQRYVNLPETGNLLTIYSFKDGTPTGSYTNYPTGMQVFRITRQEGGAKAEEITEFANLLNYAGCSIRVSGKKGIRMITGIDQNVKKSLVSKAGLAGYTLEEYGTVVQWADTLGSNTLNLDTSNKQNYAYKKGKADPIFAKENGMIQYTNVLVGFTDAQCQPDLVMRPYIKLMDTATGETVTLYGGSVTRSIGYVAWQNRDTYKPGTASYKYVWKIIDSVDTSKYPN